MLILKSYSPFEIIPLLTSFRSGLFESKAWPFVVQLCTACEVRAVNTTSVVQESWQISWCAAAVSLRYHPARGCHAALSVWCAVLLLSVGGSLLNPR